MKLCGTFRKLRLSWNRESSLDCLEPLPYCWPKSDPAVEKYSLLKTGMSSVHLSECNSAEAGWGDGLVFLWALILALLLQDEQKFLLFFSIHSSQLKEASWCLIIQNSLMLLYIACVILGRREVSFTLLFEVFWFLTLQDKQLRVCWRTRLQGPHCSAAAGSCLK